MLAFETLRVRLSLFIVFVKTMDKNTRKYHTFQEGNATTDLEGVQRSIRATLKRREPKKKKTDQKCNVLVKLTN